MSLELLAERGLENFSLWLVARSLGMSHTAMTQRYEHLDDLLCDLWSTVGATQVEYMMRWVNSQLHDNTDLAVAPAPTDKKLVFAKSKENYATLELLVLSCTRAQLREVVRKTFGSQLDAIAQNDPVAAAQTIFLLALVIGVLAEQRSSKTNSQEVAKVISEVVAAVSAPAKEAVLEKVDASHMGHYAFNSGDERKDRVLASCLENVGRYGYAATTTKMIARDSGVSEGAIFSMFTSKADIFFEATTLQSQMGYKANLNFIVKLNEKHGSGIGNAILIREWLSPNLSQFRSALLEETRLVWHNHDLRKRINKVKKELLADGSVPNWTEKKSPADQAAYTVALALPIGFYVIAEVFPAAEGLPFSTITQSVF